MRLISQNGKIDVPYEKVILGICDQNNGQEYVIYAYHDSPRPLFIATYSNTDKALKIMEMLRNAYMGIPLVMQNVDLTEEVINELKSMNKKGLQIVNADTQPRVDFISNCYFQFPKDEEVEV